MGDSGGAYTDIISRVDTIGDLFVEEKLIDLPLGNICRRASREGGAGVLFYRSDLGQAICYRRMKMKSIERPIGRIKGNIDRPHEG